MNGSAISLDPTIILDLYPASMDDQRIEVVSIHQALMFKKKIKVITDSRGRRHLLGGQTVKRKAAKRFIIGKLKRNPDLLRKYVDEKIALGYHVYWRRVSTAKTGSGHSRLQNMLDCPAFALDIDGLTYDGIQDALDGLSSLPQPTMAVWTGHGLHVYWSLREPLTAKVAAPLIKRFVEAHQQADDAKDVSRLLRVPGSINYKDHSPLATCLGRSWSGPEEMTLSDVDICQVIEADFSRVYHVSDLLPGVDDRLVEAMDLEERTRLSSLPPVVKTKRAERKRSGGLAAPRDVNPRIEIGDNRHSPPTKGNSKRTQGSLQRAHERSGNCPALSKSRVSDISFVRHIEALVERAERPRAGRRNSIMAEIVVELRRSFIDDQALSEGEIKYVHSIWFRAYDGKTGEEESLQEFRRCYLEMPIFGGKGKWIEWIQTHEVAHPALRKITAKRTDARERLERLANVMFAACQSPSSSGKIEAGRVAMAWSTAGSLLGLHPDAAGRLLRRLEVDGLVRCVYLGNRATGLGSEYVCLDENGDVIEPELAQDPAESPETWISAESPDDVADMEVAPTAHPGVPEGDGTVGFERDSSVGLAPAQILEVRSAAGGRG
ncbi:MAG: hypothetical protein AB7I45_01435 [Planctomycetota bacterium]